MEHNRVTASSVGEWRSSYQSRVRAGRSHGSSASQFLFSSVSTGRSSASAKNPRSVLALCLSVAKAVASRSKRIALSARWGTAKARVSVRSRVERSVTGMAPEVLEAFSELRQSRSGAPVQRLH